MPKRRKSDKQKEAMIAALEQTLGVVTGACKRVGITRNTHYRWLKDDPKYAEAVAEVEEMALDFAESMLHKQIREGSVPSTMFYLKCKGKRRGYIEKQEVEHSGEVKTTGTIVWGGKTINV
jgi:hypothetical protein